MFFRDIEKIKENIAIVDMDGTKVTYGELEEKSKTYLECVPRRSFVFILCDLQIETVEFYYCMINNQVVPFLVDPKQKGDLLYKLIELYKPSYLWCTKAMISESENIESFFETEKHVLIKTGYEEALLHKDLALLLTTSGSTGSPKLVRLSYQNLRDNAEASIKSWGLNQNDRCITALPIHYTFGLSFLHMHWILGATVCVTSETMMSQRFWDFFVKEKVTNLAGVPYSCEILKRIGFLLRDYPALRMVIEGGGKLLEEDQKEFASKLHEKNIEFYIAYGQTEGTTILSIIPAEYCLKKIGSVGIPIQGLEAEIENSDGEIGELIFKGDSVSMGYALNREDLQKGDENHGILHTGDMAYIDEEGYIFLKGRLKRFVKVLGARVNLDEVEQLLQREFVENQFACIGDDSCIEIYYAGNILEEQIRAFCKQTLSIHHGLAKIYSIKEIPRMESGKIMYQALKKGVYEEKSVNTDLL